MGSGDQDHDLSGVHDSADADRQCLLRNLRQVAVEEAGVGLDGVLRHDTEMYSMFLRQNDANESYQVVGADAVGHQSVISNGNYLNKGYFEY